MQSPSLKPPGFAGDFLKADRDLALLAIRNDAWALQWVTDPKLRRDPELVSPGRWSGSCFFLVGSKVGYLGFPMILSMDVDGSEIPKPTPAGMYNKPCKLWAALWDKRPNDHQHVQDFWTSNSSMNDSSKWAYEPTNQIKRKMMCPLVNQHGTPKWRFGRWFSFSNRWFSGSILIFRGVPLIANRDTPRTTPSCPCRPILYLSHLRMMALATMLGCKMGKKIAVSWLIPTYLEEEGGPRKLFVDMARVWVKYSGFLAKNVRSRKKEFWSTSM